MKKIITILCAFIFTINLSVNVATVFASDKIMVEDAKENIEEKDLDKEIVEEIQSGQLGQRLNEDVEAPIINKEEKNSEVDLQYYDENDYYICELENDKSYELNISTDESFNIIHTNSDLSTYDILVYDTSENIIEAKIDSKYYIRVDNVNKIRISVSTGEKLQLGIPKQYKDYVTIKTLNTPILVKKQLGAGKSYEIKNSVNREVYLANSYIQYNILHFDSNNNMVSSPNDCLTGSGDYYSNEIGIHSNGKVKVQMGTSEGYQVGIPYEYSDNITISEMATPVFKEITLYPNKGYQLINTTSNDINIMKYIGDDNILDTILYDKNGEIVSAKLNQTIYSMYKVGTKQTVKIFNPSQTQNVRLLIPYELKDNTNELTNPVFYKLNFVKDKVYEMENISNCDIPFFIKPSKTDNIMDYIIYDKDNNIEQACYNYDVYNSEGYIGMQKYKMSLVEGDGATLAIPYEYKEKLDIKEVSTPVFYTVEASKGEVYEIDNTTNESIEVQIRNKTDKWNNLYYDYLTYSAEYDERYATFDCQDSTKNVNSKHLFKIGTTKDITLKIAVPYGEKVYIKKSDEPMFQIIQFEKGKTYDIESDKETSLYIRDKYYSDVYDFIVYDKDGNFQWLGSAGSYKEKLNSNCKYRFSLNNTSNLDKLYIYIPYDAKITIKENNGPLIKTITLDNKSGYEIINKTNKIYELINDYTVNQDNTIEYIGYDKQGKVNAIYAMYSENCRIDNKIRIKVKDGNQIVFKVPYEFEYELNKIDSKIMETVELLPNKTYEIVNSQFSLQLNYDNYFEGIGYSAKGDMETIVPVSDLYDWIYSSAIDYDRFKIKVVGKNNLLVNIPVEYKNNIKEVTNTEMMKEEALEGNKSYIIKNNNLYNVVVKSSGWGKDKASITFYDGKGNLIKTEVDSGQDIVIKPNETIKITPKYDNYLLYVPLEVKLENNNIDDKLTADFNDDGKVDALDIALIANLYNKETGQTQWNAVYDLNKDDIIDLFDLVLAGK